MILGFVVVAAAADDAATMSGNRSFIIVQLRFFERKKVLAFLNRSSSIVSPLVGSKFISVVRLRLGLVYTDSSTCMYLRKPHHVQSVAEMIMIHGIIINYSWRLPNVKCRRLSPSTKVETILQLCPLLEIGRYAHNILKPMSF